MIVVDTCVVLWLANAPEMLSNAARASIKEARASDGISIADVTLYEVAYASTHNRMTVSVLPLEVLLAQIKDNFIVLPISPGIARIAAAMPAAYPRDPMDRIIGATALDLGVPLITADRAIQNSKALPVIW